MVKKILKFNIVVLLCVFLATSFFQENYSKFLYGFEIDSSEDEPDGDIDDSFEQEESDRNNDDDADEENEPDEPDDTDESEEEPDENTDDTENEPDEDTEDKDEDEDVNESEDEDKEEEEEEDEYNEQDEDEYGEDEEELEEYDEEEYLGINFDLLEVDFDIFMPEPEVELFTTTRAGSLGKWTDYNGLVFGEAYFYESVSGGGLAIAKYLEVYNDLTIGANYSSLYDPSQNIGEYTNENGRPAFLYGGNDFVTGSNVNYLDVYGGAILMNEEMAESNINKEVGFRAQTDSAYETKSYSEITNWFERQYEIVQETSKLFLRANDVSISISDLSDGSYIEAGADYYKNKNLSYENEVIDNTLFVTVRTDTEVNFGQWWPVFAIINFDVNWALDYDVLVFNFPDAVNVTMNSSAFSIKNLNHWSTTEDAWIGEQGMAERLALAEKVIYNFPQARSVEANQALIQGTILAPNAVFTGIGVGKDGHIYGHVVVKDFYAQGNFTIHPFSLSHWAVDLVEDTIENEIRTGAIALRQYLYLNGQPTSIRLEGGEFYLMNDKEQYFTEEETFTEDIEKAQIFSPRSSGSIIIENVPIGMYILANVKAPEGFTLNQDNQENIYTYAEYPVNLSRTNETVSIIRYSEPAFTDLYFKKVEKDTGEGLLGAVFTVVREADEFEGTTIGATYTSDENGLFISKNLAIGAYDLLESSPPEGYGLLPDGKFRFWVQWDTEGERLVVEDSHGNIFTGTEEDPVIIENDAGNEQNSVVLVKYARDSYEGDISNDSPHTLSGAQFQLLKYDELMEIWEHIEINSSGDPIDIVTNDLGYCLIQNIENGIYRLTEVKAPYGYSLKNQYYDEEFQMEYAYEFVFTEELSHLTAYIPDTALTTDIILQSVGIAQDGSRLTAEGISYKLEHLLEGGTVWEEVFYSRYTNFEGQLILDHLEKGEYRLTQVELPSGFHSIEPDIIYFNVTFNEYNESRLTVFYNDEPVDSESYPISFIEEENLILIQNEIETRNLSVYKIDNDYSLEENSQGGVHYIVDYLEGAVFRLQRRINSRTPWKDYGESFSSQFIFDEYGEPVLDEYGNHISAAVFQSGLFYGDYQLVEIEPPRGYHTNSSIEVTLNDGTKGYQMHMFTITSDMIGVGGESRFIIEDYKKTVDFSFTLSNSSDITETIPGAVFLLYKYEGERIEDFQNLELWLDDTEAVETITGEDGQGIFKALSPGTYLMLQTKAGEGFMLPVFSWRIDIDQWAEHMDVWEMNGEEAIPLLPDELGNYMVTARKMFFLPMTGGIGVWPIYILGAGLILIGFGFLKIYIIRRGRDERK